MQIQSSSPSGIGKALQQLDGKLEANSIVYAGEARHMPLLGSFDLTVSEARMFAHLDLGPDGATETTPDSSVKGIGVPKRRDTVSTFNNDLRNFCTGQPPKQSFLAPGGRTPPRFRMSRRSTLADKPELDSLLKTVMITYKGKEFLPLDENTVHRLSQYLNGSKPLAPTCLFTRLMITSDANKIRADRFVATLEQVGVYCKHLAIISPFHAIEFGNVFACEVDTLESGSDWERILQCFPNLQTVIFEYPAGEPTILTRDTFYALNCALANSTTLKKIEKVQLDVPPRVLFDYHCDYHYGQRQCHGPSPHAFSATSLPLTMVGSDMVYADDVEASDLLDVDVVFGKVETTDEVDAINKFKTETIPL
ncbi:uncharacterized protein EKO05_0000496 [Ascochyta rabiei]|uniref:Uncharacterized protein n=1 Tax=Didymella rabiei TaxID=5454 RepID=A0A163J5Q0_DIDRA|nr:uncharacterized protein EKO05_0000496 [Ascochyta rabiei]KZM26161.1 hypothetical protein ST47_g2716 [Ascochyta rabiei]UPX09813.1 hypothetical protein EKO05_0000496 [Ascochyta rabiei]